MSIIWHNGIFKDDQPVFFASDRVRIGDGVFDTLLAIDGAPVLAPEHFERLLRHAGVMKIPPLTLPSPRGGEGCADLASEREPRRSWVRGMIETVEKILHKNNLCTNQAVINTIITRGPAGRGLAIPEKANIQIAMKASPAPDEYPPISAIIAKTIRRNEKSPLSWIKSLNYGDNIFAMGEAQQAGGNEAILLNNGGAVTCATSGNVFIVRGQSLYTPPLEDGVVDGIIRGKLIRELGAQEQSLSPADLENATGIYITSSVRGVVPVISLDGKKLTAPSLQIDKNFHLN